MSRAERLFALMQALRRHRVPVTGDFLATELGVSLRTLYRDIAALRDQGARIDGEAGVGYLLRPGFLLPPLMFSPEEIEALVLGARWVAGRADTPLAEAARNLVAKVAAVLPGELRREVDDTPLLVAPGWVPDRADQGTLRRAIRAGVKVEIDYGDQAGQLTRRRVWPFALGFFDHARMLVAWCELRGDFRHFRLDRIRGVTVTGEVYPRSRQALLKAWREKEGIDPARR